MSILVPVTFGNGNDSALAWAVKYAQETDTLLHAMLYRPLDEFSQEDIDAEVDQLSDRLDDANIAFRVITRVDREDVAKQLCDFATDSDVAAIFVSLATKPVNGSYTLGHQVQRLLLESPCTVVVVREESVIPSL